MKDFMIPEGLDLKAFVKKAKINYEKNHGISEGFIAYVLDSIYKSTILKREETDKVTDEDFSIEPRYAYLNTKVLKNGNSNYQNSMNCLISENVIVSDNFYIPKTKAYGYRLSEEYEFGRFNLVQYNFDIYSKCMNSKDEVVKKFINKRSFNEKLKAKRNYLFAPYVNNVIKIDERLAKSIIENYYENLKAKFNPDLSEFENINQEDYILKMERSKIRQFQIIDLIGMGKYNYDTPFDEFGQRFHTLISQLKKEARRALTFEGQRLISIDIKNSQPYCLIALLDPKFYEKRQKSIKSTLFSLCPNLFHAIEHTHIPLMLLKNFNKFRNEIDNYIEVVTEGRLYETLMCDGMDRDLAKETILKLFYRRFYNSEAGDPIPFKLTLNEKKIYDIFPNILTLMYNLKDVRNDEFECKFDKNGKGYKKFIGFKHFSSLMQRFESNLVLDRICRRLYARIPEATPITIHDCIIVPQQYRSRARMIIQNECRRIVGYSPKLDIEILNKKVKCEVEVV